MEDKKIVSEDALRGALGVAADKTTENTALLAEANIRAFDGIISKRNFITYPALSPGDIVYSEADNGFYTYIEQVGLDPLATDSLLPGGGSISTPKFSFMPYAEYMDGDTPAAAILYRERSTATLYRYDAATASLVRYADAQTLTAELQQVRDEFAAENDRLSTLVDALAYAADQTEPGHTLGKAFREIGYTDAESVQALLESIEESKALAKEFEDGTRTTFRDCRKLVVLPQIDTSNMTSMRYMFYDCTALTAIPLLDTSKVTDMSNMFGYCYALTSVPFLDTSKVTDMSNMFSYCKSLTTIPLLDTSNVTNIDGTFQNCSSLTTISSIDISRVTTMGNPFLGSKEIHTMALKGLGSNVMYINFSPCAKWGTEGEASRQSLIDTLINYSYDRAGNGLSKATLKLHADTKVLLTDEEKAQIVAKGFTIS